MESIAPSDAAEIARRRQRRQRQGAAAVVACALLAVAADALLLSLGPGSPLANLDLDAQDGFFRLRNERWAPRPPEDVVIVAIDEPSLQELGLAWPWPRSVHAALVDALAGAGAAVVAFDVVFADPTTPDADEALAAAIRRAGNVVLGADYETATDGTHVTEVWVRPLDVLADGARGSGLVKVALDPDGAVRRAFLRQPSALAETPIPSFDLVVAETFRRARGLPVDPKDPGRTFRLPVPADQPVLVNYLGPPRTVRTVSYYQALDPEGTLAKGFFQGKIALVGLSLSSTPELRAPDQFAHPFLRVSGFMPGVEVHANLLDTLLRERSLHPLSTLQQVLLFVLFLALGALLLARRSDLLGVLAFLGVAALLALTLFLLFLGGRPAAAVTPVAGLALFLGCERLYRFAVLDREKRFISKAFRYYVSPSVVDQLTQEPERLNLYGEYYDTTVVFTDLAGFTSIAERAEPMELRRFLTGYFTEMVDIFMANQGTLDKFIGDAIMCFFGVPVRTPEHAYQGALTAYQMHRRLLELNEVWVKQGLTRLSMRVGVNSGRVVAGNMGTKTLFNFTIMGDCVNLGSRLEGANKFYGTNIIMGEAAYELTGTRFDTRKLDRIRVKGKNRPISIYELLGPRGTITREHRERVEMYEEAFAAYEARRFQAAIDRLATIPGEPDGASRLLAEHCREYLASPPGEDWDGAYTLKSK